MLTYADGTAETRTTAAPGARCFGLRGLQSVTIGSLARRPVYRDRDRPPRSGQRLLYDNGRRGADGGGGDDRRHGTAVITNRYAPWRSLTITKQVTGGYGDTRRAFAAAVDGVPVTTDRAAVTAAGGAA